MNLYIYFINIHVVLHCYLPLCCTSINIVQFFFIKYAFNTTFKNLPEFYIALGHFPKVFVMIDS